MPTTVQNLRALGEEIQRRRKQLGIQTLLELKERTNISVQFLSGLERGYVNPKRGIVVPSDDKLERIAEALEIPLSRLHALLGRMPDTPFRIYKNAESAEIAEEYDNLPSYAQQIVRDAIKTAKLVVEQVEHQQKV